jgi:hypothetical protein
VADDHEVVPHNVPPDMLEPNPAVGVWLAVPKLRPEIVTYALLVVAVLPHTVPKWDIV